MNKTLPGMYHKNLGRTAHMLPNSRNYINQNNYRAWKNTKARPADQDVLATHRTEAKGTNLTSHYTDVLSGNKYTKQQYPKRNEIKKKVQNIDHGKKAYTTQKRYFNRAPYIRKEMDLSYVHVKNVNRKYDEPALKRELIKKGVKPVAVKLHQDPITHAKSGEGIIVFNGDTNQTAKLESKVHELGMRTERAKNFNHMVR